MTVGASVATLLRRGVRDLLADLDLGCPIIAGNLTASNDPGGAIVTVVTYPAGDTTEEIGAGQTITACQVSVRSGPHDGSDPVTDMQEAIRDALTWVTPRDINGVTVVLSHRQTTSAPPIPDDRGRPTVYDTYDMRSGRPGLIPSL